MHKSKSILYFCFIALIAVAFGIQVHAMNTEFETEDMTDEEIKSTIDDLDLEPLNKEPAKYSIRFFDVNGNGDCALALKRPFSLSLGSKKQIIAVFSHTGNYKYGYQFSESGTFDIKWDDNDLIIYSGRRDILFKVDPSGNIVEVKRVSNTRNNNSLIMGRSYNQSRIDTGDYRYELKGPLFFKIFSVYFKLSKVGDTGLEETIYKTSPGVIALFFFKVLFYVGISVGAIILFIRKIILFYKKNQ